MFSSQLKKKNPVVFSTVLPFLCCAVSQLRGIPSAHCTASDQSSSCLLPLTWGSPGTPQRVRGRSKRGHWKWACWGSRASMLTWAQENKWGGRKRNFHKAFLSQIYRDTVKQSRVLGEGRLNKLIANQQDCHERLQSTTDFHRETPNPKLSPADQLGAATASAFSVPLQCNHNYSTTLTPEVPVPLRGGHTQNYLFSFLCAMSDEDLKVWVLATKVTAVKTLLEIFARTGEKSLPTSWKGTVYKGNPVQSCRDSKNVVDIPRAEECQCGKEDEAGCCFTCSHSGDKLSRPTEIPVVSWRAVSRRKIFHEDILDYWLNNFFVPDHS